MVNLYQYVKLYLKMILIVILMKINNIYLISDQRFNKHNIICDNNPMGLS